METVKGGKMLEVEIHTSGCEGQATEIRHLEHVVLNLTVDYSRRGDLAVYLTSPSSEWTLPLLVLINSITFETI